MMVHATAIACPFEQQVENIAKYGDALPASAALYDGAGARIASVTHSCEGYTLGTDAQGVAVVIDEASGAIVSHGLLHAGQALTSLRSPMQLPAQVR